MSTKTHLEDAKVYTDLRGATLHIGGSLHTGIGDINVDHEVKKAQSVAEDETQHVEELWSSLTDSLKERAMEICGEEDRFRGEKIAIAPLQISTELPSVEKAKLSGHGHRREDIAHFFRKEPQGNVTYRQLFQEVKRRVKKIPEKGSTLAAENKFLLRHGNLVVISGQPGIGKSTMTKHLVEEMWESWLNDPDIIFFVRFRDVDYDCETDLLQFLAPFVTTIPDKEDRKRILEKMETSENVFIIMDGLDEATIDPKMNQSDCYGIETISNAERFIQNLMTGNILPRSKKMVTSRPYRLAQLPKEFQPKVLFTIQGLDEAAFEQICLNICGNNNARHDKILSHLHNHPDLKIYCHTPVICNMVMESLSKMFALTEENDVVESSIDFEDMKNVNTLTSIFVFVLTGWLLEKLERTGKFQIKNISSLAFKGFKKDQFYFREFDLNSAGVNFHNTTAFLNAILKGTKIMYFVHLMWQEFLVAVNLRLYTKKGQFIDILSSLGSAKFEVVSRFLFGLCNDRTLEELLDYAEIAELNSESDREEGKELLKQLALEKLQNAQEPYFESILPILGWVREIEDKELTKQAAAYLKDEVSIDTNQIPSDIPSLNHVLRARETHLALIVLEPYIVGNYLNYFFKELHKTLNLRPNIQMLELWLNKTPMDDDLLNFIMTHCIDTVETLSLQECKITSKVVAELTEQIMKRKEPLKELVLESNPDIDDDGAVRLLECLGNIESLSLNKENISTEIKTRLNERAKKDGCKLFFTNKLPD